MFKTFINSKRISAVTIVAALVLTGCEGAAAPDAAKVGNKLQPLQADQSDRRRAQDDYQRHALRINLDHR